MIVPTARQRVMAYLNMHRTASAAQIGRGLQMSAATVRHHLSVLSADGRAVEVGLTHKAGRGRPVKLFGPSNLLQGNNLGLLSDVVLNERLQKLSPAKRAQVLRTLARGLIGQMGQICLEVPLGKRLARVVDKLNEVNYQSRWEAGAEGPRITFGHCPYAAIIEKHPELCVIDAAMLEEMMGQPARQTAKIGVASSPVCVFQIG